MNATKEKRIVTPMTTSSEIAPLEYNQCQEAVKRLTDYLSNELEPTEAETVQTHLSQCRGCFAKFHFEDTLLKTIRDKVDQVSAPQTLRDKILGLLTTKS